MYELFQFDEKPRMTEGEGSVTEEFISEWQLSLVAQISKKQPSHHLMHCRARRLKTLNSNLLLWKNQLEVAAALFFNIQMELYV